MKEKETTQTITDDSKKQVAEYLEGLLIDGKVDQSMIYLRFCVKLLRDYIETLQPLKDEEIEIPLELDILEKLLIKVDTDLLITSDIIRDCIKVLAAE